MTSPAPFALPDYKARDLIDVHGLTPRDAEALFDRADHFFDARRTAKPAEKTLDGRTVALLFFEASTRTLLSFDIAAKRLGALTMAFTPAGSSVRKGETLVDTALTLEAMGVDAAVIRHGGAGAPERLAEAVACPVVNAGDGARAHPTQALLDAATLRRHFGRVAGLRVLICGDIRHSRVARSNLALLTLLGAEVRLCAPATLFPPSTDALGVACFTDLDAALEGVDAVMALRLQKERMSGGFLPSEGEYRRLYGLDHARLKAHAPDAMVMHPGPMNRGVEIDGALADDPEKSLVLIQVEMGPAMRMAVLEALILGGAR